MANNTNSSILQNASAPNFAGPPSLEADPAESRFVVPLIAIGFGIVLGNALVCTLFLRYRSLRTITNTFVISLAVSDMMVAVIFLPTYLTGQPISPYIIAFILFAYLFNFCGVTLDRYRAILCPLVYHGEMTRTTTYKILATVWSVPVVLAIVPLFWEFKSDKVKATANQIYTGFLVLVVIVCAVFVCWAYTRIFGATRRQVKMMIEMVGMGSAYEHEEISGRKFHCRRISLHIAVEIKAAKVFALVALTFAICWLPLIIINVFDFCDAGDKVPPELLTISLFSLVINALVDPLIYSLYKSDFRAALKRYFNCFRMKSSAASWQDAKSNKGTTTSQTLNDDKSKQQHV